jgi:hypothetical protein
MTRRPNPAIGAVMMALALFAAAPRAMAQFDLAEATIRATDLTAEQTAEIQNYVKEALTQLSSSDPLEVKRARERLLAPLRQREISVRFRQEYSNQVLPTLRELQKAESDLTLINSLRIAGELATTDASALLEQRLEDERTAVRFAAVTGIGRTFEAVGGANPAITTSRVGDLVQRVSRRVAEDESPHVTDAAVRALLGAMSIARPGFEAMRGTAFGAMASSLSARARAAGANAFDPELCIAIVRGGEAARNAMAAGAGQPLGPTELRAAAELDGFSVALVMRRIKAADFPTGDVRVREAAVQLVRVAETAIPLISEKLGRRVQPPAGMSEALAKATDAGDKEFFRMGMQFISMLEAEPFGFPTGHFLGDERALGGR